MEVDTHGLEVTVATSLFQSQSDPTPKKQKRIDQNKIMVTLLLPSILNCKMYKV